MCYHMPSNPFAMSKRRSLDCLPSEIICTILSNLDLVGWRRLRLISMKWNILCHRLVWAQVAVVPCSKTATNGADWLMFDCSQEQRTEHDLRDEYQALTYQQVHDLDEKSRKAIINYTTVVHIRYNDDDSYNNQKGGDADLFELMAGLFERVEKVRVSCKLSQCNEKLRAFQKLLDRWKERVEFSIGFDMHNDRDHTACIDISGMKIAELHLHDEGDGTFFHTLPIWTKDKSHIRWSDFPSIGSELGLVSLSINLACKSVFRSHWIPETVKHLRIFNRGWFLPSQKIFIPCGVERLYLSDFRVYDDHLFVGGDDDTLIETIETGIGSRLKAFHYFGATVSNELVRKILQVREYLEDLDIRCRPDEDCEECDASKLIDGILYLKQLRLPIYTSGDGLADTQQFSASLPELEQLHLDIYGVSRQANGGFCLLRFRDNLLAKFLCIAPKLSRVVIQPALGDFQFWERSWAIPGGDVDGTYIIDVPRARECLQFNPLRKYSVLI